MNFIKCPKCGREEPGFDYAHVCGPLEVKPKINERIRELAEQATDIIEIVNPDTGIIHHREFFDKAKFFDILVNECCLKLLDMDKKTNGNHNYYKHAAIELKRHFKISDEENIN